MNLTIDIDAYNEYNVTAYDPSWNLEAMIIKAKLNLYPTFGVYDEMDGCVILHRKDLALCVSIDIEHGIRVGGQVQFEGDDRFDHTLVATELSLTDCLEVAAIIRELVH